MNQNCWQWDRLVWMVFVSYGNASYLLCTVSYQISAVSWKQRKGVSYVFIKQGWCRDFSLFFVQAIHRCFLHLWFISHFNFLPWSELLRCTLPINPTGCKEEKDAMLPKKNRNYFKQHSFLELEVRGTHFVKKMWINKFNNSMATGAE